MLSISGEYHISQVYFFESVKSIVNSSVRNLLPPPTYSADYPTYRDTLEGGEVESPNEPSLPLGLPNDFNITENDKNAPG